MTPVLVTFLRAAAASTAMVVALAAQALDGFVIDAVTGQPIADASVLVGKTWQRSDEFGRFDFGSAADNTATVSARAPGYMRHEVQPKGLPPTLALTPFRPKALYLSAYGIGSESLRGNALKLIDETELNALVIDIKDDRGLVPYRSAALAAAGLPQAMVSVSHMPALLKSLREHGAYLIARLVVFKDEPLAAAHPEWAVRNASGAIWRDANSIAWIDPFRREAWERTLAMAQEAAELGFDEIQFDYLRFPDAVGLRFSQPDTQETRVAAITGFLDEARERLARFNIFIAADIFGYVAWNTNDTQIGQQLEAIAGHADYLCPMLYPSGFSFGIPGHRDPVASPYEIVHKSLQRSIKRTGLPGLRFRPWLQAFRDYAFDKREFGAQEIRLQIDAAEASGSDGWMLWNPRNQYSGAGLKRDAASWLAP